ncbi:hypothetical protein GF345_05585 [Candidatus Woesearchaeota archaeon]|nr:hypothetical protein [Candidatus Woesearchaeota archaeon]
MAKKINIPTEKITSFFKQIPQKIGPFFQQLPAKISAFFKSLPNKIKNFPQTFQAAPTDEKIAYGIIGAGIIFLLVGIIL